MKKAIGGAIGALIALAPMVALAHEHQEFTISGAHYSFVVGSLGEPVVVDDKTGVDLTVTQGGMAAMSADGDMDNMTAAKPAEGLEKDLKVEISAGGQKKVFDLSPQFGAPGKYKTTFFPTVATTYSYRFFGMINKTPVDLTFTCNPAGHAVAAEDKAAAPMGDGVVRTLKSGSFGCPLEKASLGFPEASAYIKDIGARGGSTLPLGVSIAALAVAVLAFMRRRSS